MKQNLPVTQRELNYPRTLNIVSATNLKGALTYANKDFVEVSGFSDAELNGKNHNVVRHPDMPPAAFADLWQTLKQGKSWMGIIKNRRKNGDHYWVDGFVTPVMEGSQVTGYQSVRVKPSPEHVARAEAIYRRLWKPEGTMARWLRWRPALATRIGIAAAATGLSGLAAAALWNGPIGLAAAAALVVALATALGCWFALPYRDATRAARAIVDNPTMQAVFTGRKDELGQLLLTIKFLQSERHTIVWRLSDASGNLQSSASRAADTTVHTERDMQAQKAELELVATAMNEMSATVQEVARNAAHAAEATREADREVAKGTTIVDGSANGIRGLARRIEEAVTVIAKLADDTGRIGRVVDVIRSVAEQTNLLALNAAIEAARAGDQGRGFAVVAEEVRSLAQSTQSSTGEIHELIQSLQTAAEHAVAIMEQGRRGAQESVEQAEAANLSLQSISKAVATMTDMSTQIATAAEQQSAVSEEINRNILNINSATEKTLDATRTSRLANQELVDEIERLQTMVIQFGR